MKELTKEKLAELLNGKVMFGHGTATLAEQYNLVVIAGLYDDWVKVIGDITGEILPADMDLALLMRGDKFTDDENPKCRYVADRNMILPLSDEYDNDDHPRLIRVEKEPEETGLTWRVTSNIPHAKFSLLENGEPYSEGIIIDLDEIEPIEPKDLPF